jgi:hypothetical protein
MKIKNLTKIKLFVFALLLVFLYAKPLISQFGIAQAFHITFLSWTILVLCFPISRGKVFFAIPFELIFKRKLPIPEIITWSIAIAGNYISYITTPSIYFKTYTTQLLYNILTNPWPFWIVIICSFIATFYSAILRLVPKTYRSKHQKWAILFILVSITITILLSYREFVIVFSSHGSI